MKTLSEFYKTLDAELKNIFPEEYRLSEKKINEIVGKEQCTILQAVINKFDPLENKPENTSAYAKLAELIIDECPDIVNIYSLHFKMRTLANAISENYL